MTIATVKTESRMVLNPKPGQWNFPPIAPPLRTILSLRGRSPTSVSEEAGLSLSAVNDILNGRISNPSIDTLRRIASVLKVSVAALIGESDIVASPRVQRVRVPVIGYAQGGVFVMPSAKRPHGLPSSIEVAELPKGKHFALVVRGNAMNAAKGEAPIMPGDVAICRDFREAGEPIESGKIYAVRRRLPDGTVETTLRRIVRGNGRKLALVAESSDRSIPRKISAPSDLDGNPGKDVHILGKLVRTEQLRD